MTDVSLTLINELQRFRVDLQLLVTTCAYELDASDGTRAALEVCVEAVARLGETLGAMLILEEMAERPGPDRLN
jgi:hypothetical protein